MTTGSIFTVLKKVICEVLPQLRERELSPIDTLEELGANSVERADIVLMVLEELNLNISPVDMFGPRNIGELVELLNAKVEAG
jgi:polyketide biosynthesis acyl carrier protein